MGRPGTQLREGNIASWSYSSPGGSGPYVANQIDPTDTEFDYSPFGGGVPSSSFSDFTCPSASTRLHCPDHLRSWPGGCREFSAARRRSTSLRPAMRGDCCALCSVGRIPAKAPSTVRCSAENVDEPRPVVEAESRGRGVRPALPRRQGGASLAFRQFRKARDVLYGSWLHDFGLVHTPCPIQRASVRAGVEMARGRETGVRTPAGGGRQNARTGLCARLGSGRPVQRQRRWPVTTRADGRSGQAEGRV